MSDEQKWYRHAALRAVLLATAALAVGLVLTVDGLNGPAFWPWSWRRLPLLRTVVAMGIGGLPWVLAQLGHYRWQWRRRWCLALLVAGAFALQLAAIGVTYRKETFTLRRLRDNVLLEKHNGYYTDAGNIRHTRRWLGDFAKHLEAMDFSAHAHNKPPGSILFFRLVRRLVPGDPLGAPADQPTPWAAGLLIALLAALACLTPIWLAREFAADEQAGFIAASYMALCPGLLLFLPQLDQALPLLSVPLLIAWHRALRRPGYGWGIACGLVLALALFISWNFLVLGAFMVGDAVLVAREDWRERRRDILRAVVGTVGALAGVYLLLWWWTGYCPLTTFVVCLRNQAKLAAAWQRPWPLTVFWDLYDFALGSAWVSCLVVAFYLRRAWRDHWPAESRWAALGLAQIGIVALTGVLRTETARVWLFMLPLLLLPVGLELRRWRLGQRMVVYACVFILLLLVNRHLWFLRG